MVEGGCVCGAVRIKSTGQLVTKVRAHSWARKKGIHFLLDAENENDLGPLPLS